MTAAEEIAAGMIHVKSGWVILRRTALALMISCTLLKQQPTRRSNALAEAIWLLPPSGSGPCVGGGPTGSSEKPLTSHLSDIRLLQYPSVICGFPDSGERNLHFAIPRQGFVDHAHGFAVDGTSLTRPSPISKRLRRICDVEYGDLSAAVKADREQGRRRHIHFLSATGERKKLTSRVFPHGLKVTDSDLIAYDCAARLGCELSEHPSK